MKVSSVLLVTTIVGIACLWAPAQACVNRGDACPNCVFTEPYYSVVGSMYCSTGIVDYDRSADDEVAVCNVFACNCDKCEPGCSSCQAASGFGGALAPAANTTATAGPCSSAEGFIAMTVPELMAMLNAVYCANASGTVGFKFLGYILHLVDTNKDGVISCAEYNADQVRNTDFIKKKPACPLSPAVKLKNAHKHA